MQLSGSVNQAIGLDYRDSEPADGFFLAEVCPSRTSSVSSHRGVNYPSGEGVIG